MKTRWSTVLAALCLTLMALGSGRAAHAASVEGAGTVVSDAFGVLHFSVSARSDTREYGDARGTIRVGSARDQVHFAVTDLAVFEGDTAYVEAVVTHSTTSRLPVGSEGIFYFVDGEARQKGDRVAASLLGLDGLHPLTSGKISVRP